MACPFDRIGRLTARFATCPQLLPLPPCRMTQRLQTQPEPAPEGVEALLLRRWQHHAQQQGGTQQQTQAGKDVLKHGGQGRGLWAWPSGGPDRNAWIVCSSAPAGTGSLSTTPFSSTLQPMSFDRMSGIPAAVEPPDTHGRVDAGGGLDHSLATKPRRVRRRRRLGLVAAGLALLAGCTTGPTLPPEAAPVARACPGSVPTDARCWFGQDSAGAHYVVVMPARWSGVLVLHAHGGPTLGAPKPGRALEDLQRWSIWVRAGHAFAASTFAQGGVAVRAAAEDTERLRRIVLQHVATPRRTVLHGQSWGAGVAAKAAEMFTRTADGRPPYDAVLLTSGVLGGGTRSYDFRLDLRVVYQYLCHNHPRPDETPYPLWMGLPVGATMTPDDLRQRTRECLGLGLPAAQRTADQARRLKTLVAVIRIPESSVQGHLNWATFHFADIAQRRSGGQAVFGNVGAQYSGSDDDRALNAGVARYAADAQAVARFAHDTDPSGRIPVPVLTVHAVNDPVAFVELEHEFRRTMQAAGRADQLVQIFTSDREHSYLSDPVYPALIDALLHWADGGGKPTPQGITERCTSLQATWGAGCRFLPGYAVAPLDSRVVPRQRP